jgi:hypothetical protein
MPLTQHDLSPGNKPDLILHAGTNSKGPIVAVSKFAKSSGDYKIGKTEAGYLLS